MVRTLPPSKTPTKNLRAMTREMSLANDRQNVRTITRVMEGKRTLRRPYLSDMAPRIRAPTAQPKKIIELASHP